MVPGTPNLISLLVILIYTSPPIFIKIGPKFLSGWFSGWLVGWLGWSENGPSPTIRSFYAYPSKIDFHTKFHQNWTKIVEVSRSHVVGGRVGWLGWLGGSDFFYRLISQADHQDKAPYKISTQYLKAFRSYPI